MTITGHKTRSVFDRYHIVNSRDVLSALQRTENALTLDRDTTAIHRPIPAQSAPLVALNTA